ncbi:MAG: acyl-CoA dehydrogenase [Phyllobacteriaceae bacterium]|nr:acyl-CoA dehydrogenase [Phyllobacteriaceae bacterium]
MSDYVAPLRDIRFVLDEVVDLPKIATLPGYEEATADLVGSILEEAGKIAAGVVGPLNQIGDEVGSTWAKGDVTTPEGWSDAWNALVEGGWNGLPFPAEWGGMGLPQVLNLAVQEMWQSANMAFALCPMLTQGAVHAIELFGSEEQKAKYLPNMVSGVWTGTMNLTEPQAGSDLAAVRSKAVPEGDLYRISGQKIFITYGEQDLTENIVHLVLARLPDAPPGVKGISLFVVPKVMIGEDGSLGERNDVHCASIEHKLGIHGSPTAVLVFGEKGGALGELIGLPNRGLEYMFTMMNHARLNVGLQGLAIAERAHQQALAYARERVQGKPVGWREANVPPIVHHPDVVRMLVSMKTRIEAMRGLLYTVAAAHDLAHAHPDADARKKAQFEVDLLTPVAKGWSTETGQDVTSLGVQVHGGMGYIEETGAAQHLRDARITTIYEGTTAIQSNALVGRSVLRDGGVSVNAWLDEQTAVATALSAHAGLSDLGLALTGAIATARDAVAWLVEANGRDSRLPFAVSVPFLMLTGALCGGIVLGRAALAADAKIAAGDDHDGWYAARIALARAYFGQTLPDVDARWATMRDGGEAVLAVDLAHL